MACVARHPSSCSLLLHEKPINLYCWLVHLMQNSTIKWQKRTDKLTLAETRGQFDVSQARENSSENARFVLYVYIDFPVACCTAASSVWCVGVHLPCWTGRAPVWFALSGTPGRAAWAFSLCLSNSVEPAGPLKYTAWLEEGEERLLLNWLSEKGLFLYPSKLTTLIFSVLFASSFSNFNRNCRISFTVLGPRFFAVFKAP